MGKVSIVKIEKGVQQSLVKALYLVGGLSSFVSQGDRVLLKPNLNGVEGCTNIELFEALLVLLRDYGVKNIVIAESTFGDARTTEMFFNKTGYRELAKKHSIPLINLNESEILEITVKNPLLLDKLRIAKEVFEADKIINLPNMKVHYATGITLALKNLKGLLVGGEKRHFHEAGLDKAITDLNNTIKAHLHIVDAISCMERMGPRGGDIVQMNFIMAGANAVEVDYVGMQIMGYSLDEVKHLKYCIESQKVDINEIEVVGESIENTRRPFEKVKLSNIIPKEFSILDSGACSSCMNTFLLSCSLLEGASGQNAEIHLGSARQEKKSDEFLKIAFGNCTPDDGTFDIRIRGCPPYPFALHELLKKQS